MLLADFLFEVEAFAFMVAEGNLATRGAVSQPGS